MSIDPEREKTNNMLQIGFDLILLGTECKDEFVDVAPEFKGTLLSALSISWSSSFSFWTLTEVDLDHTNPYLPLFDWRGIDWTVP